MSSFLEKELSEIPSYEIIKNDGKSQKKIKINIYNDDTVLELLNKIAIKEGLDYKYIFAWLNDGDKIMPLSFIADFSLQNPFKLKEFLDKNFINKEGVRISTGFQSLYHTLLQNIILREKEIHYCTIFDYLKYYKIKNELNDDEIREVLKMSQNYSY